MKTNRDERDAVETMPLLRRNDREKKKNKKQKYE